MAGRVAYTGGIVRNGLVLNLDAAKRDSYPKTGTVWSDISGNGNNGILNGATGGLPSYNSANGGYISFDGTDDYVDTKQIQFERTNPFSLCIWVYPTLVSNHQLINNENSKESLKIFFIDTGSSI